MKLVAVLKERETGDLLTLQAKDSGEWIQVAVESRSFRIEVKSNYFREDDQQLSLNRSLAWPLLGGQHLAGHLNNRHLKVTLQAPPQFFYGLADAAAEGAGDCDRQNLCRGVWCLIP